MLDLLFVAVDAGLLRRERALRYRLRPDDGRKK